jgi:hypothetical protein
MIPWLFCMAGFIGWRVFAICYASVVNDMIFGYHRTMCVLWVVFILASIAGWVIVYSQHMDLRDLTRLEDIAKIKVLIFFSHLVRSCYSHRLWTRI